MTTEKERKLEAELEVLRKDRMRDASRIGQLVAENTHLLRVVFQLSEALQYEKTH